MVAHSITPAIEARYVRIIPLTWHGHISMRAEFYGCDSGTTFLSWVIFTSINTNCRDSPFLFSDVSAPTPTCQSGLTTSGHKLSASSEWNANHGPANANLHHKAGKGRTGAWSAKYNNANQWLQVDLGKISKITAVATQGRQENSQWVKSYTLEYSLYGTAFVPYKENNAVKVNKNKKDFEILMCTVELL